MRIARARNRRSLRHLLKLYALILAYAAVDEWLQIPVGRTAEWGDWLADAVGALTGLLLGTLVIGRVRRPRQG